MQAIDDRRATSPVRYSRRDLQRRLRALGTELEILDDPPKTVAGLIGPKKESQRLGAQASAREGDGYFRVLTHVATAGTVERYLRCVGYRNVGTRTWYADPPRGTAGPRRIWIVVGRSTVVASDSRRTAERVRDALARDR